MVAYPQQGSVSRGIDAGQQVVLSAPSMDCTIKRTLQGAPVNSIRPTTDIRPLAEFRANLAAVVEQVQRTKRPVILTQHGRSAAVLVDAEAYEAMQDRLELLEDIRAAEAELARGEGVAHGKAKAAVLSRLRR